jgi:hypothetical protein
MGKSTVFIGSSVEGLEIARAVEWHLDREAEVTLWSQGVFGLGLGTLEALVDSLDQFDFGVLVLTPDDLTESRGHKSNSPRDNVLIELGLFLGNKGRNRTFVLCDRKADLKIPGDLAGVTLATFSGSRSDRNLRAAVSPACTEIIERIRQLGRAAFGEVSKPPASGVPTALRPHSLVVKTSDQAATAREVCICGIHNSLAIVPHMGFLRRRLRDGMKMKVVLLDPKSRNTGIWDGITNKETGFTRREIESSLSALRTLDSEQGGLVEVKLVDVILPFSMFGVDIDQPSGVITVEFQSFGVATDQRPHILVSQVDADEWYPFYRDQFGMIFNYGHWAIGDTP